MALGMAKDAFTGRMHEAVLMSSDSDLLSAVRLLQDDHGIPVTVLDPPGRHSDELARVAARRLHMDRRRLNQAQLPNPVEYRHRPKTRTVHRPDGWDTNEHITPPEVLTD